MRRTLALATVLAAVLLAGGCVSLPSGAPPPPHMAPAAARTPSPVPSPGQVPGQASARTALVTTAPTRAPEQHTRGRRVAERRSSNTEGHRPPRAQASARSHTGTAARPAPPAPPTPAATPPRARHQPAPPVVPRRQTPRPHTTQPRPTYDMRTVCAWSHQSPVPPAVGGLCDAYVH
ncbi:hypothetical protein [Streptomyces sp. NPDC051677]|uniref:hypothetical protein n=1 Tax=Streptomyces sp. NPDC051677 TaxID=3365669 RepID=UPI0037D47D98